MSELPRGWEETTIGNIAPIETGSTPPKKNAEYYAREICFYKPGDLDAGGTVSQSEDMVSQAGAAAGRLLPENSLLVTCIGNLGKSALTAAPSICNQQINAVLPTPAALPKYLYYWSRTIRPWLEANSSATTVSIINKGRFSQAPIKIAPFAEQRRIVAKIDSLSAKSRRARDHLDHIPRLVEKYKQTILAAAFRGELTHKWRQVHGTEHPWRTIPAGGVIQDVVAGKNLRCEERPPVPHERGVVKVSAVTWGSFDPQATKTLPADFCPPDHTRIQSGDFLISRANTLELVGAVVIVQDTPTNLFLSDKILRLEMEESAKPWMLWFLRSPSGRAAIEEVATGNQLSMRNLSQVALREIDIPWPNERERVEIVRRIETAFAWIDRLSDEATSARKLIGHLDQAVLTKAFRGELVPQDPSDEPASVLLEKIKTERSAAIARPRKAAQQI